MSAVAGGGTGGQHPIDRLIRDLVARQREATDREIDQLIERMATAPFNPGTVGVRLEERGATYQGQTLGPAADSLTYHLVKRVVLEEQWAGGTTAAQYLEDLRRAVRSPYTRLVLYARRGGPLASTITPTAHVLPPERRGARSLPLLLVVYSVQRSAIISGYQFSTLAAIGVPAEARWLK